MATPVFDSCYYDNMKLGKGGAHISNFMCQAKETKQTKYFNFKRFNFQIPDAKHWLAKDCKTLQAQSTDCLFFSTCY